VRYKLAIEIYMGARWDGVDVKWHWCTARTRTRTRTVASHGDTRLHRGVPQTLTLTLIMMTFIPPL